MPWRCLIWSKFHQQLFFISHSTVDSAVSACDAWHTFAASNARPRSIRATAPKPRSEHVHTFAGNFNALIVTQLNKWEWKSPPQSHYNLCATKIAQDQSVINTKIKEVDQDVGKLLTKMTERQKQCAGYAEAFSRVRQISQQLSRCNTLLNQNIELMESLNNKLDVEDRLEPFVWTTN